MFARILIIAVFLNAAVASIFAQSTSGCPVVSVFGPSGLVPPGETARYGVLVEPINDSRTHRYEWSLSYGVIKTGQGTSEIEVIQPNKCITATVEIGGLPSYCPTRFSETACGHPAPVAEKLGEISGLLTNKKVAIVKDALNKYSDQPHIQFFFIISGINQKSSRSRKHATLKKLFKADPKRATYILSEKKDDKITVWAVPPGATPPTP